MDVLQRFFVALLRVLLPCRPPCRTKERAAGPVELTFAVMTDMGDPTGIRPDCPAAATSPSKRPMASTAILVIEPEPFEPRSDPLPQRPPEQPAVAAVDLDILRLLPESLGVARYFFLELWSRCGSQPGEVGPVTVSAMTEWAPSWTESRIRKALKKLSDPLHGYIAVENLSARGQKRILVNRPTRIVREMPLFDYAADRGGHGSQNGGDGCEIGRNLETETTKNVETPEFSAVFAFPPTEAELQRRRAEMLNQLEKFSKNRHQEERDTYLSIKNNQEVKKTRIQEDNRSPSRIALNVPIRTETPQYSPIAANPPKNGSHGPRARDGPVSASGVASLSQGVHGVAEAVLHKRWPNSPGMILERDEIIAFVEKHWGSCRDERSRKSRWKAARRVAVCAVDLGFSDKWEKSWKPWATQKASSFGKGANSFVRDVCKVRGVDLEFIDKIGKQVIGGWK